MAASHLDRVGLLVGVTEESAGDGGFSPGSSWSAGRGY